MKVFVCGVVERQQSPDVLRRGFAVDERRRCLFFNHVEETADFLLVDGLSDVKWQIFCVLFHLFRIQRMVFLSLTLATFLDFHGLCLSLRHEYNGESQAIRGASCVVAGRE